MTPPFGSWVERSRVRSLRETASASEREGAGASGCCAGWKGFSSECRKLEKNLYAVTESEQRRWPETLQAQDFSHGYRFQLGVTPTRQKFARRQTSCSEKRKSAVVEAGLDTLPFRKNSLTDVCVRKTLRCRGRLKASIPQPRSGGM